MHRILVALQGLLGQLLLSAIALLYLYLALTPFTWDPPRWVKNGALLEDGEILVLASPGMLQSEESAPLLSKAIEQNKFRLSLRFRSALPVQNGPARIFTISANPYLRNLTIGQDGHDLVVRLRTPQTTVNGLPPYVVTGVFASKGWHQIELRIEDSEFGLTLDGREVTSDSIPQEPLRSWDPNFPVALGNESTWTRPWLGEIAKAVATVGKEEFDYLQSGGMVSPPGFWIGNEWRMIHPRSLFAVFDSPSDLVLNLLCFVPVGFLLVIVRPSSRSVPFALSVVAVGSLLVETVQFGFAGRHPSAIDWIVNVAGTCIGVWLACSLKHRALN